MMRASSTSNVFASGRFGAGRGAGGARCVAVARVNAPMRACALGSARVSYAGASAKALRCDARGVTLGASRRRSLRIDAMFEVRLRARRDRTVGMGGWVFLESTRRAARDRIAAETDETSPFYVDQRFTEKAIKVVMLAQEEARRLGHNFVGTEQVR